MFLNELKAVILVVAEFHDFLGITEILFGKPSKTLPKWPNFGSILLFGKISITFLYISCSKGTKTAWVRHK